MTISKLFYTLAIIVFAIFFLIEAKVIMAPVFFAVIFTVLTRPMIKWLSSYLKSTLLSFVVVVLLFFGIFGSIFFVLSQEVYQLFDEINTTKGVVPGVLKKVGEAIPLPWSSAEEGRGFLIEKLEESSTQIITVLTDMMSIGGSFLLSVLLCVILTYFLLVYTDYFKEVIQRNMSDASTATWDNWFAEAPKIIRSYFLGTLMVIGILFVLNSILFFAVKMTHPLIWALLISLFAIIPYVGTAFGLLMPLSYSIISSEDWIQPLAIFIGYAVIQQIEGNIITPKIVGDQVRVNPLVALLATIVGGLIWGVAGAVVALPAVGLLRMALLGHEETRVIGELLGSPSK